MKLYFSSLHHGKWNGGVKANNLWVNILNQMGIESYYIPNVEGKITPWLVDHCPQISVRDMMSNFNPNEDLFVTTWPDDAVIAFIRQHQLPCVYMDLEWKWTLNFMKNIKWLLGSPFFKKYWTHSHHIKKLVKLHFDIDATVVNEWSNSNVFYYDPSLKRPRTIGYTHEENSDDIITSLKEHPLLKDKFNFLKIEGDEKEFAEKLRTCEYFLGTNDGKYFDDRLGMKAEGCPRTQQEALHCGCVLLAKDVIGNREYLIDEPYFMKTGFFVDLGNTNAIAKLFHRIETDPKQKSAVIQNALKRVDQLFKANDDKMKLIRDALGERSAT